MLHCFYNFYKNNRKTMKKIKAFSMMELMVCVVAVTIMASVLIPTITQKAKKADVRVNADQLSDYCSQFSSYCDLCYPNKCVVCQRNCGSFDNLNVESCTCKDGSSGGGS